MAKSAVINRKPAVAPPFTLADIRRAIPAHCFEKSLAKSFYHLGLDIFVCASLWIAACFIDKAPGVLPYLLWPLYWFFQGAFATGIWVISHECGHGAFSNSNTINDAVGLVFHSLLLVPYYSWKHSHRRHHQNTGSVAKDEVFVPPVAAAGTQPHWFTQTAVYRVVHIAFMSLLGWPLYLVFNIAGRPYDRWANHFTPQSPIFTTGKERAEVVVSDLALAAMLAGLAWMGRTYGFLWLTKMYIIPYLMVNHWLVMITFLQHTHPSLPHYDDAEWDWLRGALATIDRSYGFLDHIFHHIADTHVAHHLFSYMPHYHAQEATQAMKKVLGEYYAEDKRNVFAALWSDLPRCMLVAPDAKDGKVLWFSHAHEH